MKKLFSIKADKIRIFDKEKLIFKVNDDYYVDKTGNRVELSEEFINQKIKEEKEKFTYDDDPVYHEGLKAESNVELEWEIDDAFGNFGFKNKDGEFVIKPQYAWANEFSYGLAAVNLNRTWYKSENGEDYYENHMGYINTRGETIIPFSYDEAYDFNKYGVAVVSYRNGRGILIDRNGNQVEGTEKMDFSHYYFPHERFIEFSYIDGKYKEYEDEFYNGWGEKYVGIYDTKERKVLIEPSSTFDDFDEMNEDLIMVYELREGGLGPRDWYEYYIDSEGKEVYLGLKDMKFAGVEAVHDKEKTLIVQRREFIEIQDENVSPKYQYNGKEYKEKRTYGLYSEKGELLIDAVYNCIHRECKGFFSCFKGDLIDVIQIEEED